MLDLGALDRQIRALDAGTDSERREAIRPLKDITEEDWAAAPPQVVQSLVEALKRQLPAEPARAGASREIVLLLGKIGPRSKPAVKSLVELLNDKSPDVIREAVAATLGKIGRGAGPAVDRLIELLANCRPAVAVQAVRALGSIGHVDDQVRSTLASLWRSSIQAPIIQVEVGIALCRLGMEVPGVVPALTNAVVANQDAAIRRSAAEALAWCGPKEIDVVPGLLRAAQSDKQEPVRQAAEAGLAKLGVSRKQAISACAVQLADSVHAEAALRQGGEHAVAALIDVLADGDPATSEKAARVLGALGAVSLPAAPALQKALQNSNPELRLAAAKSLWLITNDATKVTPVLIGLLREKRRADAEDAEDRRRFLQTVIEALRRIGPPAEEAIPALVEKSKDKNRLVSESALAALKDIRAAIAK